MKLENKYYSLQKKLPSASAVKPFFMALAATNENRT